MFFLQVQHIGLSERAIIFLISQGVITIGAFITIYVKMSMKLTELDIRMKVSENRLKDVEETDHEMNGKLDKILERVTNVQIELQNKENRKY